LLAQATAPHGPAQGFDSAHFLAAADSLRHDGVFADCEGRPFDLWPPLQPILLALALELGLGTHGAVLALNIVSLGALLFLTARIASALSPGAGSVAAVALLVSTQLFWIETQHLAEPVYMALAALTIVATQRYGARPSLAAFWLMTTAAALTALQRYIGVTVIGTTAIVLLLTPATQSLRRRLRRALGFALAASLPLGAWMARNVSLGPGLSGTNRGEWGSGLGAYWFLRRTWLVTEDWLFPGAAWTGGRWTLTIVVLVLFALACVWPLVAGMAFVSARVAQRRWPGRGRVLCFALLLSFGVHVYDSGRSLARELPHFRRGTVKFAYNLPPLDDDALWTAVEERSDAGPMFSNDPPVVYVRARVRTQRLGATRAEIRRVARSIASEWRTGTLVWIRHNERDQLPIELFERHMTLTPWIATELGTVYAFKVGERDDD
jgi:hypothetical protein